MGIVTGDHAGDFRPGASITGPEAAAMIVRMLGFEKSALQRQRGWPDDYLDEAECLGIWALADSRDMPINRGTAAEALAEALQVTGNLPTGPKAIETSPLSCLGATRYLAEIRRVYPPSNEPSAAIAVPDGTVSPSDGELDLIALSPTAVIHGVDRIESLQGKTAEIFTDREGRAIYVGRLESATLASVTVAGNLQQVLLSNGMEIRISDAQEYVTVNHRRAGVGSLEPGMLVSVRFGASDLVVGLDAFRDIEGQLEASGTGFTLISPDSEHSFPVNASEDTQYTLNGRAVARHEVSSEVQSADIVLATVHWDELTGSITKVDVRGFDSQLTLNQLVTESGSTSDDSQAWIKVAAGDTALRFARLAIVIKDKTPMHASVVQRGDIVSYRTDGSGNVTYLEAETNTAPLTILAPAQVNTPDRYSFQLTGPIDSRTLTAMLADEFSQLHPEDNGIYRITAAYSPLERVTTVIILPDLPFRLGTHLLRVKARDFSGREISQDVTFEIDLEPMRLVSVEWASGAAGSPDSQSTVALYFDGDAGDQIAGEYAMRLENWTFTDANPRNDTTHIAAVTHAGYYVTLAFDGPIDPGSRLRASLLDTAGNTVVVDCVYTGK